jgi:hypothetical protein
LPVLCAARARIIETALTQRNELLTLPLRHPADSPVHPALCAALAGLARARMRSIRMEVLRFANRLQDDETQESLVETERSHSALRAAVFDYTHELKASSVPEKEIVSVVQDAVHDCAVVVGADDQMRMLLLESEAWALEAYRNGAV